MPCDTQIKEGQTLASRNAEIKKSLQRLEAALRGGVVKVNIGPNGAVAFTGWKDRGGITDVCAYRTLTAENSWELRRAVATAEGMTGRRVNPQAVASGEHSHDDGKSWHPGHK